MDLSTLGGRIKHARRQAHLSGSDLADALGMSKQAVSQYENNHTEPNAENLAKIAQLTSTDLNWLIAGGGAQTLGRWTAGGGGAMRDYIAGSGANDPVHVNPTGGATGGATGAGRVARRVIHFTFNGVRTGSRWVIEIDEGEAEMEVHPPI